jgi:hypothetical protein
MSLARLVFESNISATKIQHNREEILGIKWDLTFTFALTSMGLPFLDLTATIRRYIASRLDLR